MASKLPPVKGAAYTYSTSLFAQADNEIKTTPTLAAGDVKVIKDGGASANITSLPSETPASSGVVSVTLSSTEMNADEVVVVFKDASGAEWWSQTHVIHTAAQTHDATDVIADAIKAKTDNLPASPAAVGSAMTLANGAITAAAIATDAIDADALAADAVAEINATVDTAISDASLATAASIAALNDLSAAQVNAEVVDALNTDTYAEPTGTPVSTTTLAAKINWLYKYWRNLKAQTADTETLYNDDGTTADITSTVADDGTTATKGEWSA